MVRVSFTDDAGNEETLTSAATDAVTAKPNSPATGAPAITGTAQVGETLTASTSGISDADGLNGASFSYQWVADDSDIAGATTSTYILNDDDEGKTIMVQVSFTDDAGNKETLTSAQTAGVVAIPAPLIGLTVSPGTLTPAFQGHTKSYTVPDVANADGRITLVATARAGYVVTFAKDAVFVYQFCPPGGIRPCNEWNYQDEDGNEVDRLTDADANAPGFQVDLGVGENELAIHVFSENIWDDELYGFTITRAANSPATAGSFSSPSPWRERAGVRGILHISNGCLLRGNALTLTLSQKEKGLFLKTERPCRPPAPQPSAGRRRWGRR